MNSNRKINAPPVYRPQPVPKVLMRKTAQPVAGPPAARPSLPVKRSQPGANVVMTKTAQPRHPVAGPATPRPSLPVNRPPTPVMQPRVAKAPARPASPRVAIPRVSQLKTCENPGGGRCNPIAPPAHAGRGTIQRVIVRMDDMKDIKKWEQRLAGKQKPGHYLMSPVFELTTIRNTEKIHLLAHGAGDIFSLDNMYSPTGLARKLIEMGLPLNYRGRIVLHSCHLGEDGPDSFATKLQDALVDYGRRVEVKAVIGTAKVFEDGTTRVMTLNDGPRFKQLTEKMKRKWYAELDEAKLDNELEDLMVDDDPHYVPQYKDRAAINEKYRKTGKNLVNKYFTSAPDRKQRLARPEWSWRSVKGYVKSFAKEAWSVLEAMSS